jgi:hypothetical protein
VSVVARAEVLIIVIKNNDDLNPAAVVDKVHGSITILVGVTNLHWAATIVTLDPCFPIMLAKRT